MGEKDDKLRELYEDSDIVAATLEGAWEDHNEDGLMI